MPKPYKIPCFAAISDDPTHGQDYLQGQQTANVNFMKPGQLFLNRYHGEVFYCNATGEVKKIESKNSILATNTLVAIAEVLNTNGVPGGIATLSQVVDILNQIKILLNTYVDLKNV